MLKTHETRDINLKNTKAQNNYNIWTKKLQTHKVTQQNKFW